MKSLSSLPLTVKVGGSAIVGGSGITGDGLWINHQLSKEEDFKFEGLDKDLVDETEASFVFSSETFTLGNNNKEAALIVKAISSSGSSKFKSDSESVWTCTIKGFTQDSGETSSVSLTIGDSANLVSSEQIAKFKPKFEDSNKDKKQQYKKAFIKSCEKNRTVEQKKVKNKLNSEIKVKLKTVAGSNTAKYEFPEDAINSIFAGTWDNKTQK